MNSKFIVSEYYTIAEIESEGFVKDRETESIMFYKKAETLMLFFKHKFQVEAKVFKLIAIY
jgi:hypothetical protein